jgi:RNA polymerase sigma factor (TIGR02999 family)
MSEAIPKSGESPREVTRLLISWCDGDENALERLMPMIYRSLQQIAHRHLNRERGPHTLQTTALVHEAYMKIVDQKSVHWKNRSHFFAIASQAMRRILIDHARKKLADKRAGDVAPVALEEIDVAVVGKDQNLIALDEALNDLEKTDSQQSRIIELRYFGGLTVEETAEVLQISQRTVAREWAMARAWLYGRLSGKK